MSAQPPANSEPPPHSNEPWRLRRVQRAQPHLGEGELSWVPLWTMLAVVIIILVTVGTFLFVWLNPLNHTDSVRSLPLTATPSRTAAAASTDQLASTPTLLELTATPTILPLTPSRTVPTTKPTAGVVRYRVKPGDTLTAIAAKYHTSVRAIMEANRLRRETIDDGQELIIPLPTPVP